MYHKGLENYTKWNKSYFRKRNEQNNFEMINIILEMFIYSL